MNKINNSHIANNFSLRVFLGQYPGIFYALYGLIPVNRRLSIKFNTDFVIEGFPRSANTFAVLAFQMSQKANFKVAHHMHVPAQIIRASRQKIPTLVIIRNPEDAVVSYVIRNKKMTLGSGLRCYVRYHKAIFDYRDSYVLVLFEEVINDFEKVITRVNEKFDTKFVAHTPNNTEIEQIFSQADRLERGNLSRTSRPSIGRKSQKEKLLQQMHQPDLSSLLNSAHEIFRRLSITI